VSAKLGHPRFVRADIAALPEGGVVVTTPRGPSFLVRLAATELDGLLRACDGSISLEQASTVLDDPPAALEMLKRLADEGCFTSGPPHPRLADWVRFPAVSDPGRPALTNVMLIGSGAVARLAQHLLADVHAGLFGDVRRISTVDEIDAADPRDRQLAVVLLDQFDADALLMVDRHAAAAGIDWSYFYVSGQRGWSGPHVRPGTTPTFTDGYARRRAAARTPAAGPQPRPITGTYLPPQAELAWMLTAFLIDVERWLAGAQARGDWAEVEFDPLDLTITAHPVLPLPDRPVLGQPPAAGDMLVDDRLGVVTQLVTVSHRAGTPPALHTVQAQVCDMSRAGDWTNDPVGGGSSFTSHQAARDAAIGEAIERYCGNIVRPELLRLATFRELCAAGEHAIDPADLVLFSAAQYTARGFPFAPLTRDSQVHWVRGHSLTADRPAWLPASLVYVNWYGTPHCHGHPPTNGTFFPGIAAARSVPDAITAGLLEVIERHATMTWWLNAQPLAKVAPTAELDTAWGDGNRSAAMRRWLIHLDNEFAVPVMAGVVEDTAQSLLTVGFAARSNPAEAGLKAWAEALTLRELAIDLLDPDGGYRRMFARGRLPEQGVKPWRPDRGYLESYRTDFRDVISLICQAQIHLDPAAQALVRPLVYPDGTRQMADLPTVAGTDLASYQSLVEARGYEIYFADITTADIACAGYHVVRTIVPGLVPNSPAAFPFLGLSAAQQAAVSLGWRDSPLPEAELNKIPLPHA
jgi:ribosomal protein S12 methylthiotransferase accessory factor